MCYLFEIKYINDIDIIHLEGLEIGFLAELHHREGVDAQ